MLKAVKPKKVALISNGDFRDSVGANCWPMQEKTLRLAEESFKILGIKTFRANPFKKDKKHGFINTQAEGCSVFANIDSNIPVVIVMCSWVYAHHLASSLKLHKAPILLLANFDGTWPGLVALLNHSATYDRMNIMHSRLWTDSFVNDAKYMKNLKVWVKTGRIKYPTNHITNAGKIRISEETNKFAKKIAEDILKNKRILGQMDPGCMGMLNAVLDLDKVAEIGMPIELLNQSDLLAEMGMVSDKVARKNLDWLKSKGVIFHYGKDESTELTEPQVIEQMKMYTAAGIIYKRYGLSAIGIPYQYGLVRCTSASDLAEGMLNNSDRPDIIYPENGEIINKGKPIIHFNEGDLGSAIPQVIMYEILTRKNMPGETTLHDVRWGDYFEDKFIWVFEISGGAPAAHFGGWNKTHVYRQPAMYFPKGGGTCSGISKPGIVTWARFYQGFDKIAMDCGIGEVIDLPENEVKRRLENTTKEWPIANVYIPGYGRDELMSSHKSNHITICYGDILKEFVAVANNIGLSTVSVIGDAKKNFLPTKLLT